MPTSLGTAISSKTAEGVVQGVELAAPIAEEHIKKSLLHSKAAHRGGFITGGILVALTYSVIARHRRLGRIEEKLEEVVDEVADHDD